MALSSMTGFGRSTGASQSIDWVCEIKSVNGRGLDIRLRLQPPFDLFESEVRSAVQKAAARGNITISVTSRRVAGGATAKINEALFLSYAEAAERLAWSAKLTTPTVGDILRLPGVIDGADAQAIDDADAMREAFLRSVDEALVEFVAARRSEGNALVAILSDLLGQIEQCLIQVAEAEAKRRPAIADRLQAQVQLLLDGTRSLDADRLHQEAMLIATRIDVREETDRLNAHAGQARALLAQPGAVGRKLDFLTQEFMREANTLCSKANDLAITRLGLDLKAVVEQLREQVQNVE